MLQNSVDCFFGRLFDKRAGVHNYRVCFRGIFGEFEAVFYQKSCNGIAVNEVFGTAQVA
jgi:hypothetical protein